MTLIDVIILPIDLGEEGVQVQYKSAPIVSLYWLTRTKKI